MFHLKNLWQYLMLAIPPALAVIAACKTSLVISALAIGIAYIDVVILPFCRNNECTYMFFLTAVTATPINISLIICYFENYSSYSSVFMSVIFGALGYFVMLSAEEILLGIFIRLLFKSQNELDD
ncbi:MAG: hypothetical protein ACI4IK_02595 [Eubacterium sp.]